MQCGEGAESACLGLGLTFTVSGFLPIPPTKDLIVSENMLNNILRNTEKIRCTILLGWPALFPWRSQVAVGTW